MQDSPQWPTREREIHNLTRAIAIGGELLREMLAGPIRFTPVGRVYRFEGEASVGARCSVEQSSHQLFWYRYGDSNPGPVAENHVS